MLSRFAVVLAVPLLASCGHLASSTPTPGSGGSSSTTCASYDDENGTSVSVSILNKTSAPIYMGPEQPTCGSAPLFGVTAADGTALPGFANCRFSCESFRTQAGVGCPDICFYPSAITLQPGELKRANWAGLYSVSREMPNACAATDYGFETVSCDQAKRIQPGTYTFSTRAGSSLDCSATGAQACPPCMPDADGGCSTTGGVIGGSMLTATSTVALDARYGVFSMPAAGQSPGAADAAPVEMLTVELVFTN